MRKIALGMVLAAAFVLAACGGGASATNTPVQTAAAVVPGDTPPPALIIVTPGTATPEGYMPVGLPGTLVKSNDPDPNAGVMFTRISFSREGGVGNIPLSIEITGDGMVVRTENNQAITAQARQDDLNQLRDLLNQLNFFAMQATFVGPVVDLSNNYLYSVTVERGEDIRLVKAQDGYMPREMKALLAKILSLGVATGPTFGQPAPTSTP